VNLLSLNFFRSRPKNDHQFAVIGLGDFGRAICLTLHNSGYEVLATDIDEKRVSQILTEQVAAHALQLDSTDPFALKEAGIFEFDTVIVAIGNYVQESIITTLNLKEAGVPHVVARASSEIHVKLLKRVGADDVVYPEYDAGCNLARSLTQATMIVEHFQLGPDYSIIEQDVPEEFHGKRIAQLQLYTRYGLNLLAVKQDGEFMINPDHSLKLYKGSTMVILGSKSNINRLPV